MIDLVTAGNVMGMADKGPTPFPIVEAYGYAHDADTPESRDAIERKWCRFMNAPCEKFRQYRFGYCSVTYSAAGDDRHYRTYAVCDHRLDGEPVSLAVRDHSGQVDGVELVPEVGLVEPRESFDYVAIRRDGTRISDAIAIETQAIDIRGGGVGPDPPFQYLRQRIKFQAVDDGHDWDITFLTFDYSGERRADGSFV